MLQGGGHRYHIDMILRYSLFTVVLGISFLQAGCANSQHKKEIIEIQKNRIEKLEKYARKQKRTIEKLKAKAWSKPPVEDSSAGQSQLEKLIRQKKWVSALKKSSELRERYPNSEKVLETRIFILRKMGLNKEANVEQKNLLSKIKRTGSRNL